MKELEKMQPLTFVHPNGEEWFDLTKLRDKYKNSLIRDSLGDNDLIHKIISDENTKKIIPSPL